MIRDGYQQAQYIDLLAAFGEDVVSPTELQRILINVPPRHGKSYIQVALSAYTLGVYPRKEVLLIVHSQSLAIYLAGRLKLLLESPFFRKLFPEFRLQDGRQSLTDFRTTAGGGFFASGIEGPIQGRGADVILIDDVVTMQNAQYESSRTLVKETYLNTIQTRLNNQSSAAIFALLHRSHEDDLPALLIKLGFVHISLPFRAMHDEHIEHNGVTFSRKQGETLRYFDQASLRSIEEQPPYVYSTQYQQHPIAREAGTIKRSHFPITESRPMGGEIVVSWDCASSTIPGSSYSVGLVMQRFEGVHYLLHIVRGRYDFRALKAVALEINERFKPSHHLVEAASTGFALASELREKGLNVIDVKVAGASKIDRLDAVAGKIYGQQVHIIRNIPGVEEFLDEITAFPYGANDDQVDALTQYLKWLADNTVPPQEDLVILHVRPRSKYDAIKKMVPGVQLPGQSPWRTPPRPRGRRR
ncbi:MAG: hypothetical protein E5X14_12745 [Mesorhizobium sp.]|nr:MAG: hypothetical protein E5X14_12745 [Mesorhizobium sp.]